MNDQTAVLEASRRRWILALLATVLLAGLSGIPVRAQQPQPFQRIAYTLSMPVPVSHLFEVSIDVQVPPGMPPIFVDFQMPRWQPGRYSVVDFAKNVQEFKAVTGGHPLTWTKTDDQTWRVQTAGNRMMTVSYKVYGNDLSGTFAQLDATHGNYNGGEVFMYIVGHKQDPVDLKVNPPLGWKVVSGRTDHPNQVEWRHSNYEMMIDNPTEIGPDWTEDSFKVGGKTYRVVVHSRGDEGGRRPGLVRDIEKIVRAETAMWGPPEFDQYTFLLHFAADGRSSDGMEHLFSTQIIEPGPLAETNYMGLLDDVAHEFFHAWNVKRLRPVELGPWDWTRPPNTKGLWIAEGFTQYYGDIMLRRAGLEDDGQAIRGLSRNLSGVETEPGNKLMSAEAASMASPFIDDAPDKQRTNLANDSISYYTKGEAIATVLDLLIRGRSHDQHSLDEVMRRAYDEFYLKSPNASYYLKGRGYTEDDFIKIVSQVAGWDATDFFNRYIRGVETLPYEEALGYAGLRLVRQTARIPHTAGMTMNRNDRQSLRIANVRNNSDAERAGLQQDDVLISIGGTPATLQNWRMTLNQYKEGERIPVTITRFRKNLDLTLVLGPPDSFEYAIEDVPNPTVEQKALRSAWLSGGK